MRIAQVAPLYESCPPRLYGGTERVVSNLTEELVRQGHEVTLFASGDSLTAANLVPCCEMGLRLNPAVRDPIPYHMIMLDEVRRRASSFDIIHFHLDILQAPIFHDMLDRTVTTLHGRLDLPDLLPFYARFSDLPLVSISDSQRSPLAGANWVGTVYHGLPADLIRFTPKPREGYLAFLGRISPEKRPDRAIEIAARTGLPLKIAAKVDKADQDYWDKLIGPMIAAHDNVEYIGEINDLQKPSFLGNASALLFPIDWPEPFGLVMIEAMACGTPVVAFPCGAAVEVIDDGVSGVLVDSIEAAVSAVRSIDRLDRAAVRARFDLRFTASRMARDYVNLYRRLVGGRRDALLPRRAPRDSRPVLQIAG